jgi:hypothetical protein
MICGVSLATLFAPAPMAAVPGGDLRNCRNAELIGVPRDSKNLIISILNKSFLLGLDKPNHL